MRFEAQAGRSGIVRGGGEGKKRPGTGSHGFGFQEGSDRLHKLQGSTYEMRVRLSSANQVTADNSDEYAPMKAAKQLRRGKRISEVEVKYGKDAVELATIGSPIDEKPITAPVIPELSPEFFESPFFRRFQVQREYRVLVHCAEIQGQS